MSPALPGRGDPVQGLGDMEALLWVPEAAQGCAPAQTPGVALCSEGSSPFGQLHEGSWASMPTCLGQAPDQRPAPCPREAQATVVGGLLMDSWWVHRGLVRWAPGLGFWTHHGLLKAPRGPADWGRQDDSSVSDSLSWTKLWSAPGPSLWPFGGSD